MMQILKEIQRYLQSSFDTASHIQITKEDRSLITKQCCLSTVRAEVSSLARATTFEKST